MEDLLSLRGPAYGFQVLRDRDELYLLDTGFLGGISLLRRGLKVRGWEEFPIKGIILTHGHLDHTFNVAALAEQTGAWVAAPQQDVEHYAGRFPYRGTARVCGALEAAGRKLFGYRPFVVNRWLKEGDELPIWGGLRVFHLPGHTAGHSGFYQPERRLLFCGDLFASFRGFAHLPPAILNSQPEFIAGSVRRALSLDLEGVVPQHADRARPNEHLARLSKLSESLR